MVQTGFDDMGVFSDGCNIRSTAIHIALVSITGYQAAWTSRSPGKTRVFTWATVLVRNKRTRNSRQSKIAEDSGSLYIGDTNEFHAISY